MFFSLPPAGEVAVASVPDLAPLYSLHMAKVKIQPHYRVTITIPKKTRDALGLKIGDEVETETRQNGVLFRRKESSRMGRQQKHTIKTDTATPAEKRAIQQGRAAHKRGESITLDEYLHDLESDSHKTCRKTAPKNP